MKQTKKQTAKAKVKSKVQPKAKAKATKPAKPAKAVAKATTKMAPVKTKPSPAKSKAAPSKPISAPSKTHVAPVSKPETKPTTATKTPKISQALMEKYRMLLLDLRDHLIDGVNFLASDNLKRSSRDASGELSGYSLHMADAGTDNFDREFALSLVSSEQEALYEIEEALKRLEHGTFGSCEICEKVIPSERLEAVPFARMCVPCQSGMERDRRRPTQPTAVFGDSVDEEVGENEESEE
jgi:RNA polymerase-binding transcription factor DksA